MNFLVRNTEKYELRWQRSQFVFVYVKMQCIFKRILYVRYLNSGQCAIAYIMCERLFARVQFVTPSISSIINEISDISFSLVVCIWFLYENAIWDHLSGRRRSFQATEHWLRQGICIENCVAFVNTHKFLFFRIFIIMYHLIPVATILKHFRCC